MGKKEKLGDVIRNALRRRSVTQGEAAAAIQATDSALRVWLSRNRFPENILIPLAAFCDLPSERKTLEDQYNFEIGSDYATASTMTGAFGRPDHDGLREVLRILKDARGHDNPEEFVVHLHSSIGFYTGTQSQLIREFATFLKQGTAVAFLASTWGWGTELPSYHFGPTRIHDALAAAFRQDDEDWALSPSEKKRLYWAVGGSPEIPVPFPCLAARVGCVSHLAESDRKYSPAKPLTTAMLSRAKLIDMWIEVSPYVSTSPDANTAEIAMDGYF